MPSWGKFWIKDAKRPKHPTDTPKEPEAKAGSWACPLHTTPAKPGQNTSAIPPAWPLDTPLPSPYIRNQLAPYLREGASEGTCSLFSLHPATAEAANKALPAFLVWLLISFCWSGKSKNPGQYLSCEFSVPNSRLKPNFMLVVLSSTLLPLNLRHPGAFEWHLR